MREIAIVGGGILGLALGYELTKSSSKFKISIFEKEKEIGKHQSGNNSGVLHCGLYYEPGSLKARLAVDGIRSMIEFCEENQITHEICGKIVVASDDREVNFLDKLADRGNKNGLIGLRYLNNLELKTREPHVKAKKALLVPEEGIVDYVQVMNSFLNIIKLGGGSVYLENKVLSTKKVNGDKIILQTNKLEKEFDLVINCTGLYSDRTFTNFTNKKSPIKIIPFRGEYMHIDKEYQHIVNHLIYPVPDPNYPFLGVHFTRMTNGKREVGPNAVLALKREGYKTTDISLVDAYDSITYKGFFKFMKNNFSFAVGEFASSLSRKAFVAKAKKLIPDVEDYMFSNGGTAGVRAQAMDKEGNLIMDFNIIKEENQIHVLNAPSPGATASLSIARYIINNFII